MALKSDQLQLAKLWENVRNIRKRFRLGVPWVKEPGDALGESPLQTMKALELNFSILQTTIAWMTSRKVSVKTLEPAAVRITRYILL